MIPALLLILASPGGLVQTGYVTNALGGYFSQVNVLAPEMLATLTDSTSAPITSVSIRPSGTSTLIPVNLLSPHATFVVPAGVPYGSAQLIWQVTGGQYRSLSVTVAQSNFGIATAGPDTLTAPVRPGQIETITGSGLGYGNTVSATVGGVPATIIYAGRGSPAGYDQIQIEIPAGVSGCYEPLAITVGQKTITGRTVSVSPDGLPCQSPFHLSAGDLALLDKGGAIAVGEIDLSSNLQAPIDTAVSRRESASANFSMWNASSFASSPALLASGCTMSPASILFGIFDPIAVFRIGDFSTVSSNTPPPPTTSLTLQNGSALLNLSTSYSGFYSAVLPPAHEGHWPLFRPQPCHPANGL